MQKKEMNQWELACQLAQSEIRLLSFQDDGASDIIIDNEIAIRKKRLQKLTEVGMSMMDQARLHAAAVKARDNLVQNTLIGRLKEYFFNRCVNEKGGLKKIEKIDKLPSDTLEKKLIEHFDKLEAKGNLYFFALMYLCLVDVSGELANVKFPIIPGEPESK